MTTNLALCALAYFSFRLSVSRMLGDFRLKKWKYASPLQTVEAYQDALGSQRAQGSVSIMSKSGFNGMEVVFTTLQVPKQLQGHSSKLVTAIEFDHVCQSIALCPAHRKNSANYICYTTTTEIVGM